VTLLTYGWFSSKEVNPENNLVVVDLSSTIQENVNEISSFEKLMYANEVGMLEDENGNPYVSSDEVVVSDIFLNEEVFLNQYEASELATKPYAMSYYVSNHFTLLKTGVHISSGLNYYVEDRFIPNSIKVVDENGNLYSDLETGRLKYRISFESFITDKNSIQNEIPHKVIIFLEEAYPKSLRLIYDKVEVDQYGSWSKQILKYSESINSIPIFRKIQEEAEVIDPSNYFDKTYSIKRNTKSASINGQIIGSEDNVIYVNKKSIDDNRVFEVFNWRVVAKVQNSVDFSDVNYGREFSTQNLTTKTVKAGVLYSSSVARDLSNINPYVFYNLENSVFNLSNLSFENPNTTLTNRSLANYWLVDIDSVTDQEIKNYDVLSCSLHWVLTESHAAKINAFLSNAGTFIVDTVNAENNSLLKLNPALTISTADVSSTPTTAPSTYNSNSLLISSAKNNAFAISSSEFATDCGIYGYAKAPNNSYKKFNYFTNSGLESVLERSSQKIFTLLRTVNRTDRLVANNIIASTSGFLKYCNDIYSSSTAISTPNNQESAIQISSESSFSNFVEGPYKFLYNCIAVGLNDKIESTRFNLDLRSSVHYYSGQWYSDWVIDTDALFDDELALYYKSGVVSGAIKYVRDTISSPKNLYRAEISSIVSNLQNVFLDQNDENVTLYIEYTNPNVSWTNTSSVSSSEKLEVSSSYNLVKINNKDIACETYTDKKSAKFVVPSGFGPYIVKEKMVPSRKNNLKIAPAVPVRNYSINLASVQSVTSGSDVPVNFDATLNVTATAKFKQNHVFQRGGNIGQVITPEVPATDPQVVPGEVKYALVTDVETSQSGDYSLIDPKADNISSFFNAFNYTGDIDQGNTWDEYFQGKNNSNPTYVKYIQLTLTAAGFSTSVDGSFGAKTSANVKSFQNDRGLKVDGIVDSQTKMWLGRVWANMGEQTYNSYIANINNDKYKDKNIDNYIRSARISKSAKLAMQSQEGFRLINYTGTSSSNDPAQIRLWVGFRLPTDSLIHSIDSIIISGGDFGNKVGSPSYKGFKVVDLIISDTGYSITKNQTAGTIAPYTTGVTEIVNDGRMTPGRYVSLLLQGSDLGGAYGTTAEGLRITSIQCKYTLKKTIPGNAAVPPVLGTTPPTDYPESRDVTGTVSISVPVNSVSFAEQTFLVDSTFLRNAVLNSISLYKIDGSAFSSELLPTYTGLSQSLDKTEYKPDANRVEKVDLSAILTGTIELQTATVSSVKQAGTNISYSSSNIELNTSSNTITLKSNLSSYASSTTLVKSQSITGYNVRNVESATVRPGKNSFNYYDGVTLICKPDGTPYGINLASGTTSTNSELDVYYSNIQLMNTLPEQQGLQYGFYDIRNKQFIGKNISYLKYQEVGPQNLFIGLYAYDYDGDLATQKEYTGSANGDMYQPATVPNRTAYPVFKVSSIPKNKIQIMKTPGKLQKTEPWPLAVSSGSFTKRVDLNLDRPKSWLVNYNGQQLRAKYDTSSIAAVGWSKIFGRGYYDIVDETPIYNNAQSITLRNAPIHIVHEKSDDLTRFASDFRPVIKVYTRSSVSAPWQEVSYDQLRNINCKTGVVEFNSSIISSDERLTKVSYTTVSSDVLVRGSNGVPIPLNPFLNKSSVKINKPLYIYIKPTEIYKSSTNQSVGFSPTVIKDVLVEEYIPSSIVNFTYNNNIFNKYDISEYDPFAILIGIVYVTNSFADENFSFTDLRSRGGGISSGFDTNTILNDVEESISYWDVYPAMGEAYPKGGYVIIKIPKLVKKNFTNPDEVYTIVRNNITAGVVFELQDMEGKDWGSSVTTTS
jgi:peptidoglycan hydrolase-like protein with peptidoglycan-binding domain